MTPTYVLVHGMCGNSGNWTHLQREMSLRGHRTLAVDLPGRGTGFTAAYHDQDIAALTNESSPAGDVSGQDWIDHVVQIVRSVREHGPVILVGHSLGGLTVTGVANQISDFLHRIVYVSAQCPVRMSPVEYMGQPEWAASALFPAGAPLMMGNPTERDFMRTNWRGANRATLGALADALGLSERQVIVWLNGFEPDEAWMAKPSFDFRAEKDTWGRVPHTYIRLTEDKSIPLAAQDLYIKDADALTPENPFDVHSVTSGHSTFLFQPEEVADVLISCQQA
ncbi:alpha/beta hydrolase [Kibdelosporangium philippinense]|uniref:Alpha/beta hydrolase n=1 Tax=Kibdelosporangium philippinense TaxID=211113 RepID=A0ABS8ZVU9_9PSEU|nr:alpha/beta fold hydrolase [Kibdelosporangium philippinense]MCE7010706.1 alpha/beta hydrolase [Kibdelosporangium philippinense]